MSTIFRPGPAADRWPGYLSRADWEPPRIRRAALLRRPLRLVVSSDEPMADGEPHSTPTETALIEGLRAGTDEAFDALVSLHGEHLFRVADRILRNPDEAKDCLQDALVSAFRSIAKFEARSSLKTWIHRIVVNHALMRLRARGRKSESGIDELLPEFDSDDCRIEAPWLAPEPVEQLLQRRELRETVRRAIDSLPESARLVLVLRDIEGYDTDETAALLETTPGAVKTRLHRARSALKRLLEPMLEKEAMP